MMAGRQKTKRAAAKAAARVAELSRIADLVRDATGFAERCRRMLEGACQITDAAWGVIALQEGTDSGEPSFCYGLPGACSATSGETGAAPQPRLKGGQLTGLPAAARVMPSFEAEISAGEQRAGLFVLGRAESFDDEERDLIRLFAKQVGIVLRNERARDRLRDSAAQAEAETRRLSTVISHLPDAIVRVSAMTGSVEANDAARALFGWLPGEEPESVCALEGAFHGADRMPMPRGSVPVSRALQGEAVGGEELFVLRADGSLVPVLCRAMPELDEHGLVRSIVVQVEDTSRARAARERIAELSAERGDLLRAFARQLQSFRFLLDSVPVGMLMIQGNEDRTIVANSEMAHLAGKSGDVDGYGADYVFRKPNGEICRFEDRPLIRAVRTGETVRSEEMLLERRDGTLVPVLLHAAPIRGSGDEIIGAVGVAEDRSRLVNLERQRTDFVSMLSHEMKNPLTVIKGVASAVRRRRHELPEEEVSDLLEMLEEQSDRLADLLDNLNNITRLETGTFSIATSPLSIDRVISEVCTQFQTAAATHPLRVDVELDLPAVRADEPRIEQVLLNLLGNAAKFSADGTVITVSAAQDGHNIRVSVSDEGPGIAAEDMGRLFQRFSRFNRVPKPGSGLGLAICKGIVEAHGGEIWAESDGPGQGATFSFSIPMEAVPAGA